MYDEEELDFENFKELYNNLFSKHYPNIMNTVQEIISGNGDSNSFDLLDNNLSEIFNCIRIFEECEFKHTTYAISMARALLGIKDSISNKIENVFNEEFENLPSSNEKINFFSRAGYLINHISSIFESNGYDETNLVKSNLNSYASELRNMGNFKNISLNKFYNKNRTKINEKILNLQFDHSNISLKTDEKDVQILTEKYKEIKKNKEELKNSHNPFKKLFLTFKIYFLKRKNNKILKSFAHSDNYSNYFNNADKNLLDKDYKQRISLAKYFIKTKDTHNIDQNQSSLHSF